MFSSSLSEFYADRVSDRSPGPSPGRSCSGDDSIMSDGSDSREESLPLEHHVIASQSSYRSHERESSHERASSSERGSNSERESSNEIESDAELERESSMDNDDYNSYVPPLLQH